MKNSRMTLKQLEICLSDFFTMTITMTMTLTLTRVLIMTVTITTRKAQMVLTFVKHKDTSIQDYDNGGSGVHHDGFCAGDDDDLRIGQGLVPPVLRKAHCMMHPRWRGFLIIIMIIMMMALMNMLVLRKAHCMMHPRWKGFLSP